jgi:hypothetical protein
MVEPLECEETFCLGYIDIGAVFANVESRDGLVEKVTFDAPSAFYGQVVASTVSVMDKID